MKLNFIFIVIISLLITGCGSTYIFEDDKPLNSVIYVDDKTDLIDIDSDSIYILDGMIDMGNQSILVPEGGLSIVGTGFGAFGVSGLSSSENNYTLFTYNQSSYSGALFLSGGLEITITGNNSKVYDLNNKGNFNAIETNQVNYNSCDSIGELMNYRQALGVNVGVFGCDDGLTFTGEWAGGARFSTMIVRNFGENGILFKKGDNLTFSSRFFTDVNADFSDNALLTDFNESNFNSDNLFQLNGATITRNGNINFSNDYNSNIERGSVKSLWQNNIGLKNTYIGGLMNWDSEVLTPLSFNVSSKGLGVTSYDNLQHFSFSGNNSLVYISEVERDFEINGQIIVSNGANDQVEVIVRKYINSTGLYEDVRTIERKILNVAGSYDVAVYDVYTITTLNQNDKIEIWIKNKTDGSDGTIIEDSFLVISSR